MQLPDPTLTDFREGISSALDELLDSYQLQEHRSEEDSAAPPLLIETFGQLFDVMQRSEASQHAGNQPGEEAVTELGEYALELVDQTLAWASRLKLPGVYQGLQASVVTMARWIAHHGGEIQSLEPIVDALAQFANTTKDPGELLALYQAMSEIIEATADIIRQDLEKTNPGRPWRLLQLNRAIVATRTHQPDMMETAFEELATNLPQDAPQFFSEGMEQMELLNYPAHVREIMERYNRKWNIDRALH